MKENRIFDFAAKLVLFVLLLTIGCNKPAEKPAQTEVEPQKTATAKVVEAEEQKSTIKLALKFTPADLTTYRVITENDKSVDWESPNSDKPKGFTGGHTGSKIEMTFVQQIQSVDDEGNAVAKITIKQLKYLTTIKNEIVTDFDSSREKDRDDPLNKLIGQSYIIKITASGQVSKIIDANNARSAIGSISAANRTAANLLSDEAITQRHTIQSLPEADKNQLHIGGNWSSIENFSFDMMGAKSYEKIYTLEKIEDVDNQRIAVARMEAVPSAENAKELLGKQSTAFFANMSDNTETYSGELKLDLTIGKIEECHEKLTTEWIIVDPNPKDNEPPAALKMAAVRSYSIEKVD
jgi:hypothetical protein